MAGSVILLDIGNTHVRSATAVRGEDGGWVIVPGTVVSTRRFIDDPACIRIAEAPPDACVGAACVVPQARDAVFRLFPDRQVFFLTAESVGHPDFSHVDASTVGADRVANAVGALAVAGAPVIVVDAGTALTTEVVDGSGVFRGGAIAPGREMLRRALSEFTAQLPYVPPGADFPPLSGTNTRDAIRCGTDRMFVAGFRDLVAAARLTAGAADCPVLVTGGDAAFLLRHTTGIPNVRPGPPDLTFLGIAIAAGSFFQV